MLTSEFDVYVRSMARALELVHHFEGDLGSFRDAQAISERLVSLPYSNLRGKHWGLLWRSARAT